MTDTAFDFSTVEVNEDAPTMPTDQDTLQCVVCGTPLTYGGRGPKPKYCADHKKNKTTGTGTRKTKRKTGTDYTAGVKGLIQVPAMALTMVGTSTKKPEYLADAFVLSHYADDIATAVSDIANDQPQIAAVLDKVLKVGPYGALMTALMPVAIQIMANHKVIPPGVGGTRSAEEILEFAAAANGAE